MKNTTKQKKTPEEISRIRSEAARKGIAKRKLVGYAGVGRKKGWTKDPALKAIPSRTITVRDPDYKIFVRLAAVGNIPIVEFMHKVANGLKERNPQFFTPELDQKIKA